MPYKLRKAPNKPLYWVVDNTGKKYEKMPIPLERAKKQITALHIHLKHGGSDPFNTPPPSLFANIVFKTPLEIAKAKLDAAKLELDNAFAEYRKNSYISTTQTALKNAQAKYTDALNAYNAAFIKKGGLSIPDFTTSLVRQKYTTATQKWVKANENQTISAMVIRRAPIAAGLNTAFNLITAGQWTPGMKAAGYDKMYHLGVVITEENGKSSILEKLSSLNFSDSISTVPNTEYRKVSVPAGLTVGMMLDKTFDFMGSEKYFKYDAFANNCQTFIYSLLKSNGLGTQADYDWLLQPLDVLLKNEPGFLPGVAKTITNIGAIWDTLFGGVSQKKKKHIRKYLKGMGIPATRQNMDLAMAACDAEGVVF